MRFEIRLEKSGGSTWLRKELTSCLMEGKILNETFFSFECDKRGCFGFFILNFLRKMFLIVRLVSECYFWEMFVVERNFCKS